MERNIQVKEILKTQEKVEKEPVVEVLGKMSEMSMEKTGGADSSPVGRRK